VNPAQISLDNEAIMDYAALLTDDIIVAARIATDSSEQNVDYVSEHPELMRSEYGVLDVKSKEWIRIPILVSSIVASDTVNQGNLLAMVVRKGYTIELVLNGAYRWRKLQEMRPYLVKNVYDALTYELAAVTNLHHTEAGKSRPIGDSYFDDDRYYKDPNVPFFVQDVTDEAIKRAEVFIRSHRDTNYTREQLLDYVTGGMTWNTIVPKLKASDRAQVLKAAYSALVDAGLV
jgi:hypothetical protein